MYPGSQLDNNSMIAVNIIGNSMDPSLKNGELLYFRPISESKHISVDDIVLCKHPYIKDLKIVKRIKKIINGHYYVVGDNKMSFESTDSRSFGLLSPSKILGKLN